VNSKRGFVLCAGFSNQQGSVNIAACTDTSRGHRNRLGRPRHTTIRAPGPAWAVLTLIAGETGTGDTTRCLFDAQRVAVASCPRRWRGVLPVRELQHAVCGVLASELPILKIFSSARMICRPRSFGRGSACQNGVSGTPSGFQNTVLWYRVFLIGVSLDFAFRDIDFAFGGRLTPLQPWQV